MEKYIVAYSPSEVNIRQAIIDEKYCHCKMTNMYKLALSRYKDKVFGDLVAYNNQFWCSVEANNSADALRKFFDKEAMQRSL